MTHNYQKELTALTATLQNSRPRLLLHSCCGPCCSACLETLVPFFDVTVYFCNPNILPAQEYDKRLYWQKALLERAPFARGVALLVPPRDEDAFRDAVRGLEGEAEGGARCRVCFRLRLESTARRAREDGFAYFGTTLTVSPHKDAQLINELGAEIAREAGVLWLPSDFKKQGGYQRSAALSAQFGLYRQAWCGCGMPEAPP